MLTLTAAATLSLLRTGEHIEIDVLATGIVYVLPMGLPARIGDYRDSIRFPSTTVCVPRIA